MIDGGFGVALLSLDGVHEVISFGVGTYLFPS